MSGQIENAMDEFVRRSKIRSSAFDKWDAKTKTGKLLRSLIPDLPSARERVLMCIKRRIGEALFEERQKTEKLVPKEEAEETAEHREMAILNQLFPPMYFTHNNEHPDFPLRLTEETEGPNVCRYCIEDGHRHVECKELYADEEEPNFCKVCMIYGHHINECWVLHPKLKEEQALAESKKKSAYCEICGVTGKARQYCWKVHGDEKVLTEETSSTGFKEKLDQKPTTEHNNTPAPTVNINSSATPRWSQPAAYCYFCKMAGHRDKDCRAPPPKLVSVHEVYTRVKKPSKFAKTVK